MTALDTVIRGITNGAAGEVCTPDLAKGPWEFDATPGYGPGSSMLDVIPTGAPRQGALLGVITRECAPRSPTAHREAETCQGTQG